MRIRLTALLCLICFSAVAQKLPDQGLYKVRITLPDKTVVADLNPANVSRTKSGLIYYWYYANAIHQTQGGFSGKLLNGLYTEYYPNKNLKEQGSFKQGLKNGSWKSWNEDGTLISESNWKDGRQVTIKRVPLWKRVHLFKKRPKPAIDSTQKR